MTLNNVEKGNLCKLFIRKGFVLDFTTPDFDAFTLDSVGVALCNKYGLSKGQSLIKFLEECSEEETVTILKDLFHYYETEYKDFFIETGYGEDKRGEDPFFSPSYYHTHQNEYKKLYEKCKKAINRISPNGEYIEAIALNIKEAFSSEYIDNQVSSMISLQHDNPTDAIGKAKELIESCCKAVLEENSVGYDKDWDLTRLVKETMNVLQIMPAHIPDTVPAATSIKAILNHLKTIAQNVAELRNPYGSGHGKSPTYKGLEERHAKLAVGSALTLVNFLWDSHLRVKSQQTK